MSPLLFRLNLSLTISLSLYIQNLSLIISIQALIDPSYFRRHPSQDLAISELLNSAMDGEETCSNQLDDALWCYYQCVWAKVDMRFYPLAMYNVLEWSKMVKGRTNTFPPRFHLPLALLILEWFHDILKS